MIRRLTFALLASAVPAGARAQFDQQWVSFAEKPGAIVSAAPISGLDHEVDLAAGDLDLDGMVDVVVARKQPFTSAGKRTNVLLRNVGGVLVDQTALYAVRADVPGDQGFLTPTNDTDVKIADVDQDGWPDVVTATALSDGDPKHVGHPRVYRNLANGPAGWRGLRFEDVRIPQLLHLTTGLPENPRFAEVATGDTTGDGYPDLYFGDHDSSGAGGSLQPPNKDLNDRYLVNDGFGFFADRSASSLTAQALLSSFCMAVDMADFNGDGALDIVKDSALSPPQWVAIAYNSPLAPGVFPIFESVSTFSPYHVDAGDLNGDGRPDLVIQDDFTDRYRFNLGVGGGGTAQWGPSHTFDFLVGGDDGFGGNIEIADLDADGFDDVLICDVNVDIAGFKRRLHAYHNLGVIPGATDIVLREERQLPTDAGWIGLFGIHADDLTGTYDVVAADLDADGDLDLVVGRSVGTELWENGLSAPSTCQADVGFGSGATVLSVCGGDLSSGTTATLRLTGAVANALGFLVAGAVFAPTFVPELQATLVPVPPGAILPVPTDGQGQISLTVPGGGGPVSVYVQVLTAKTVSAFDVSNALRVDLLP